jgi:hypothetical protein
MFKPNQFNVHQFSAILLWIKYNDYSSVAEVWLLLIQVLIVNLGALAISRLLMPIALTLCRQPILHFSLYTISIS